MTMDPLWFANKISKKRLTQETAEYLESLAQAPILASQRNITTFLRSLRNEPGPYVHLGDTPWGERVAVPLLELVKACGLTTGGMGSGKTFFACLIIEEIIQRLPGLRSMSFGVLDAKGELFDRALYLLARRIEALHGEEREALLRRIVIIDFSSREALSSYNILSRWPYTEPDFFVTSRLETLRELLPASEKLSLRGATVLKNVLSLLSEFSLPLPYLDELLSSEEFRGKLLSRSKNPAIRHYFENHLHEEGKQTIPALRARMETLFASESVRLALSGTSAPDFRSLQNEGKIVLVNCAGPMITRGVRLLLQGLVLSDIRQSIFARPNNPPVTYLWLADEAQNFFLTRQQQENMADILTMARSFGSFFYFLCQNLSTAIPDARILEQLHTNIRWSLTLRGSSRDAQFLRPALPVTGRLARPEPHPFRERTIYSGEEERALLLDGIAHLPDRTGYLWLKARFAQAIPLRTRMPVIPQGEEFRRIIEALREEPRWGGRVTRPVYEIQIKERDREWRTGERSDGNFEDGLEKAYEKEREACGV